MILIRARSRYHIDNRAAAIAELRAEACLLDFELLNRLHRWNVERLLNARIVIAIHDTHAVEQQIPLSIAASIGNEICDEPGRADAIAIGPPRGLRNARSKESQIEGIAVHEGQIVDCL